MIHASRSPSPFARVTVISKPGAAIRVTQIELTDLARKSLCVTGEVVIPPAHRPRQPWSCRNR